MGGGGAIIRGYLDEAVESAEIDPGGGRTRAAARESAGPEGSSRIGRRRRRLRLRRRRRRGGVAGDGEAAVVGVGVHGGGGTGGEAEESQERHGHAQRSSARGFYPARFGRPSV